MDRAFSHPIKAVLHLSKLAQLAAIMPKAIRLFTLEHVSLQTVQNTSRKVGFCNKKFA